MGTDDPPAPMVGAWLPFAQAARALGMAQRALRRHVAEGRCAVRRQGRRVSVFIEDAARAVAALAAALDAERARGDRLSERLEAALDAQRRQVLPRQRGGARRPRLAGAAQAERRRPQPARRAA